jgi:hypothetical protein
LSASSRLLRFLFFAIVVRAVILVALGLTAGKESYDAFVSELEAAMTALAAQEKLPVWE